MAVLVTFALIFYEICAQRPSALSSMFLTLSLTYPGTHSSSAEYPASAHNCQLHALLLVKEPQAKATFSLSLP